MILRVEMKTPDAVSYAIGEALARRNYDEERDRDMDDAAKLCERWFRHGETVTLEVDTEAGTCVVLPA